MKRTTIVAVLAAVLLLSGGAWAHEDKLYDNRNTQTKMDVKHARIDHEDDKIAGRIKTYEAVSNYTLKKRGFFRFHFWENGKADDGVFAVAIFRTTEGMKARIFKLKENGAKNLGSGIARKLAPDDYAFVIERSKIGFGDPTNMKWTAFGYWCVDQKCEKDKIDWIPNSGSEGHFLP
jgi:hypothetical protein